MHSNKICLLYILVTIEKTPKPNGDMQIFSARKSNNKQKLYSQNHFIFPIYHIFVAQRVCKSCCEFKKKKKNIITTLRFPIFYPNLFYFLPLSTNATDSVLYLSDDESECMVYEKVLRSRST